jgi:hypothetical protein
MGSGEIWPLFCCVRLGFDCDCLLLFPLALGALLAVFMRRLLFVAVMLKFVSYRVDIGWSFVERLSYRSTLRVLEVFRLSALKI